MSASPATTPPRGGILGSWVVLGSLHGQVEHLAGAVGALWVGVTPHAKLDTHHRVGLILGGGVFGGTHQLFSVWELLGFSGKYQIHQKMVLTICHRALQGVQDAQAAERGVGSLPAQSLLQTSSPGAGTREPP